MRMQGVQCGVLLVLAACGTSASTGNQSSNSGPTQSGLSADPPFTASPVATFDNPWAMDFLPGTTMAIVTEKPGRIWLVDVKSGSKQTVAGAPRVVASDQGGLLDVKLSPTFATDGIVYLSYAEPSASGGSGLALSRAKLVRDARGARLE
jgi:glucose/arabinose dehydrogenase